MIELLPHHATKFTRQLYRKGPEGLAKYLAYNEQHGRSLKRNLRDIMDNRQDEAIILRTGQNDIFCEDCPGQVGPYCLPIPGIVVDKCDLTRLRSIEAEQQAAIRIGELTGGGEITVRKIYEASCEEWEVLKRKLFLS